MASDLSLGFTSVATPLGELTIVATNVGIVASGFAADRGSFLAQVEERLGARAARAERALTAAREDARAYFARTARVFSVPVDLRSTGTPLTRAGYQATIAIPYGELRTYGDVAAAAGRPRARRAAGHALRVCPTELWIPCHRVVPAGPGFGTYGGHPERREFLLRLEGAI
jgi:methylated-DNA-[protein]-cysteine S-methyltransferase